MLIVYPNQAVGSGQWAVGSGQWAVGRGQGDNSNICGWHGISITTPDSTIHGRGHFL